jgi:hypothetical protein
MHRENGDTPGRKLAQRFATVADAIAYRWVVERDIWVGPAEVEQARAYLAQGGLATRELPEGGGYVVEGEAATVLSAARLVLLGIRRLHASRRSGAAA